MRTIRVITAGLAAASFVAGAVAQELETPEERLSYTVGMDIGQSLADQDLELDIDLLVEALRATYAGEETRLTREEALAHARQYGFTYGIAVNCGLKMGFESDEELKAYLDDFEPTPLAWHAMQAEGREWLDLFGEESRERFDYVFTDAMTWTNDAGKRMRLWIPEETEIGDPQDFMDQLVDRIIKIVTTEPIDIYVNPTYLPEQIAGRYDELWTDERIEAVVTALADSRVALEINNRNRIPSATFIRKAKEAGVKFTFGTNNGGADDLGRMDYAIQMVGECGLTPQDMWMP